MRRAIVSRCIVVGALVVVGLLGIDPPRSEAAPFDFEQCEGLQTVDSLVLRGASVTTFDPELGALVTKFCVSPSLHGPDH